MFPYIVIGIETLAIVILGITVWFQWDNIRYYSDTLESMRRHTTRITSELEDRVADLNAQNRDLRRQLQQNNTSTSQGNSLDSSKDKVVKRLRKSKKGAELAESNKPYLDL